MGTSESYGGSGNQAWNSARQLLDDLPIPASPDGGVARGMMAMTRTATTLWRDSPARSLMLWLATMRP